MFDRRLIPGEDPYLALQEIVDHIGDMPGTLEFEVERDPSMQFPHKARIDLEIVLALKGARDDLLGESKSIYQRSALDMGFFSSRGFEAVSFGPGDPTLAHSDHELVPLEQYIDAANVYLRFLERMLL